MILKNITYDLTCVNIDLNTVTANMEKILAEIQKSTSEENVSIPSYLSSNISELLERTKQKAQEIAIRAEKLNSYIKAP